MTFKNLLPGGLILAVSSMFYSAGFAANTIKIGDINSYKRLPAHTIPYKKGTELAVEIINNAGGVLGKKLEIVSRDDQGKPGEAVKIAEELFTRDGVVMISGSLFSHIGLALTSYAGKKKRLYLAAEPLADALVWAKGNRYTFRLRPSTYMQAAMLEKATKFRDDHSVNIESEADFRDFFTPTNSNKSEIHGGFAYVYWGGDTEIEERLRKELKVSIRCEPDGHEETGNCLFTGKPDWRRVVFSKAY